MKYDINDITNCFKMNVDLEGLRKLEEYITQLENNWNELKNYIEKIIVDSKAGSSQQYYYQQAYNFMQELEKSGSNERDN